MEEVRSRYFLRVLVEDKIGVLAMIANEFAGHRVSVQQMIQKERINDCAEIGRDHRPGVRGRFQESGTLYCREAEHSQGRGCDRVYGE